MHKMVNGVKIELTAEEEAAVRAEWAANELAAAKIAWLRNRQNQYKPITEQLDMIYWDQMNGTTTWLDHITKVKTDNPKPEVKE